MEAGKAAKAVAVGLVAAAAWLLIMVALAFASGATGEGPFSLAAAGAMLGFLSLALSFLMPLVAGFLANVWIKGKHNEAALWGGVAGFFSYFAILAFVVVAVFALGEPEALSELSDPLTAVCIFGWLVLMFALGGVGGMLHSLVMGKRGAHPSVPGPAKGKAAGKEKKYKYKKRRK